MDENIQQVPYFKQPKTSHKFLLRTAKNTQ